MELIEFGESVELAYGIFSGTRKEGEKDMDGKKSIRNASKRRSK